MHAPISPKSKEHFAIHNASNHSSQVGNQQLPISQCKQRPIMGQVSNSLHGHLGTNDRPLVKFTTACQVAKSQCKKRHSLGQETPAPKSSRKQRSSLQHHNARPQPLAESQCKQRPTTSQIDNRLQSRNASNDLSQVKEQQLAHHSVSND